MRRRRSPGWVVPDGAPARRLLLCLATLLLLAACTPSAPGDKGRLPGATGPAARQPPVRLAAEHGTWRRIAPPPIPPAGGMAAAWTGRQLVVWGGQAADGHQPAGDGGAYDPAADRWEVLPPAPIAARFGASAVWTGREVLFWGGQGGPGTAFADGAAYDPATRRWRVLPAAPTGARTSHQAVWTGREMVVWGGFARCCPIDSVIHDPAAAAYDPVTDRWRRIGDVPPPWSGDDGSAVTVADAGRPMVWRLGHLAAYDSATNAWSEVADAKPPPLPSNPALPATTADPFAVGVSVDHEVFMWTGRSGELQGLAWRSSDGSWRRTATLDGQSGASVAAGGPDRIYAAAGQSARVLEYRIGEDRWEELPLPPVSTRSAAVLVWTGSELLFWGGIGEESPEMDGAIWHCC
jgi:galactose oxidase-like protein